MYKEVDREVSERRQHLLDAVICPYGWLRYNEPIFRHWERLPKKWREGFKELKSIDIEVDNCHLR